MITLTGKKISEGIAIGRLSFYKRESKEIRRIYVKDVEKEVQRFQRARQRALQELKNLYEVAEKEVGEANAAIFEMQQMILEDEEIIQQITNIIVEHKLNAEYAVKNTIDNVLASANKSNKTYIQGHEPDVKDVSARMLRILARAWKDRMMVDEPFILASGDLYPSETVKLNKTNVLGFVTKYGTINSHTAVLARTKGIPAVIGLGESLKKEYEGKMIIIDGFEGKIYIEPDYTTITRMRQVQDANHTQAQNLERLKGKENITQSGRRIDVCANIGAREDIENVLRCDAGGIGLFRSEFLYRDNGSKLPAEEQQFQMYRLAAEAMGTKKVVIRIADLGGGKQAECLDLGEESNPEIGYRGIRVLLDKEEILKTQLRAILRASAHGNIQILLPMISSLEEVMQAKLVLEKVKKDLKTERVPFDEEIPIGVMIETPAAVMISGELAREVDFFSIGTNDLTQLTLGMDKANDKLKRYYDPHHPALIKMIRIVANNVHLEGKKISLTGDLAADLDMTETLLQLGIDELSVAPNQVLALRKKIREIQ